VDYRYRALAGGVALTLIGYDKIVGEVRVACTGKLYAKVECVVCGWYRNLVFPCLRERFSQPI
jgi:hypothetical protein